MQQRLQQREGCLLVQGLRGGLTGLLATATGGGVPQATGLLAGHCATAVGAEQACREAAGGRSTCACVATATVAAALRQGAAVSVALGRRVLGACCTWLQRVQWHGCTAERKASCCMWAIAVHLASKEAGCAVRMPAAVVEGRLACMPWLIVPAVGGHASVDSRLQLRQGLWMHLCACSSCW